VIASARTVLMRPPRGEEVDAQQVDPQGRCCGRPAEQLHYAGERREELRRHLPTYVSFVDDLGQAQVTDASTVVCIRLVAVPLCVIIAGNLPELRRSGTAGEQSKQKVTADS